MDRVQRLMSIRALMGTADDDIHVLSRQRRKGLIEIEIIAGHEAVLHALDLDHIGRFGAIGIGDIHLIAALRLGLYLTGRGMSFEVAAHHIALPVDGMGGIAPAGACIVCGIDKHHGIAAHRSSLCSLKNIGIVFFNGRMEIILAALSGGNVGIFRQHDQIETFIALIQQRNHLTIAAVRVLRLQGIIGLNDAYLHGKTSLGVIDGTIITQIEASGTKNCKKTVFCHKFPLTEWGFRSYTGCILERRSPRS